MAKLKKIHPNESDILIFDPVSNDTFCGTDKKGNHTDPVKLGGSWHVRGQLSIRPKSYIKNTLKMCDDIVNAVGGAKLILLLPLPRYIKGSCCPDPEHVTNLNSPDFVDDISGGLEMVEEVLHSWVQSMERPATADGPAAERQRAMAGWRQCALRSCRVCGNCAGHNWCSGGSQ
jgi:hypothetical protein